MNPAEIKRLVERIAAKETPSLTTEQLDDLESRGAMEFAAEAFGDVPIIDVTDANVKEAVLMCTTLVMGELPTVPDNIITKCEWGCGRTIQHRPQVHPRIQKACLYCVAERLEGEQ